MIFVSSGQVPGCSRGWDSTAPFERIVIDTGAGARRREQNLKLTDFFGLTSALVKFRNGNKVGTGDTGQTGASSDHSTAGRLDRKHKLCTLCASLDVQANTAAQWDVMLSLMFFCHHNDPDAGAMCLPTQTGLCMFPPTSAAGGKWFSTFLIDGILLPDWTGAIWQVAQQDSVCSQRLPLPNRKSF